MVRGTKVLALAAVSVLVLGACSSSKKSSSAPTTSGPATTAAGSSTTAVTGSAAGTVSTLPAISGDTTTGVTATEIHVGAIEYKANYAGADDGFNARIKRLNDAGGVYGRKIVLDTVLDDGQVSAQNISDAKTLVEQDHVFAIAPVMTATMASASYLEQAKVPFLGWSIDPQWCDKTWGFGFEGNDCDETKLPQIGDFAAVEQKLFPDGSAQGKAIVMASEDNDSARVALADFGPVWEHDGAKVVLNDTSIPSPPAVVGDYTPYAQKDLTANNGGPPDLIECVCSFGDTLGLYKKVEQLGYKGVFQGFTDYDPRILGTSQGIITEIQFAPFEDAGKIPAVQQMITDLNNYKPGIVHGLAVASGYWTADLFIQALQKAGPNLSREAFYNALNGGFSYNYGGGVGPISYPHDHHGTNVQLDFVQDEGKTTGYVERIPMTSLTQIPNPGYKP
jgi:ABC-type branched-subunit amino acid transport system substrate-binding protein